MNSLPYRAAAQSGAGRQTPVWVFKGASADYGFNFWYNGRRTIAPALMAMPVNFPAGQTSESEWWYAAVHNSNPTSPVYDATPDGGAGRLYFGQIGGGTTPSGAGMTSRVVAAQPRNSPLAAISTVGFYVNGQPEMLAIPTTGSVATGGYYGHLPINSGLTTKCDSYHLMWYEANDPGVTTGNAHRKGAFRVQPFYFDNSTGLSYFYPVISTPVAARNNVGSNIGPIGAVMPGTKATFAVASPIAVGYGSNEQTVYIALNQESGLAGSEGIYCFRLHPYPLTGSGFDPITSFEDIGLITSSRLSGRTNLDESRIIGTSVVSSQNPNPTRLIRVAVSGSTFNTSELELSRNLQRIAWGEATGNKVFVAALEPGRSVKRNTTTNAPYPVTTITLPAGRKIAGLEFAPDNSYTLYVTATSNATGNGSGDGLYRIALTGSSADSLTYGTPVALGNPTIGGVQYVGTSQIETDRNGLLRMLSTERLTAYDHAAAAWKGSDQSPYVQTFKAQDVNYDFVDYYRLPRQVDGWDHNFAGHIYGPDYLKVIAPGSGETGCPTPAPLIVQTATYTVDAVPPLGTGSGKPVYTWNVTLDNGTTLAPGVTPNTASGAGLTQFTTTFPAQAGAYRIQVAVSYPSVNSCANNLTTYANLRVTTGSGCQGSSQRVAPPSVGSTPLPVPVVVGPVPAADYLDVAYETAAKYAQPATVRLLDMQGRVVREHSWSGDVPLRLKTSDLPAGVYVLRVLNAAGVESRRVVVSHE